ncbi:response regulator [bacterium]|nr:response regulator [bacterium]
MEEKDAIKVLVVDDKPENIKLLVKILKDVGYSPQALPSGKMVPRVIERSTPDIILMDINMPGMNGVEVCRHIKEDYPDKDIPVLFISALNDPSIRLKSFQAGGVDFIAKPFNVVEVIARVKVHVALKQEREKNHEVLSKTLIGSVQVMADMLSMTRPDVFKSYRQAVQFFERMAKSQKKTTWTYELLGLVIHIGMLPSDEIAWGARFVQVEGELPLWDKSLNLSYSLILKIPYLNTVSSIVKHRIDNEAVAIYKKEELDKSEIIFGNMLLELFFELSCFLESEGSFMEFVEHVDSKGRYPLEVIEALVVCRNIFDRGNVRNLTIGQISPGDILVGELLTVGGRKLLSEGTEFSENLIEILSHQDKNQLLPPKIKIYRNED